MPSAREDSDLARAARLYFVDGLSQREVASTMQTTRSNVSRMLTAAKQRGVVQVRILESAGREEDLENQLSSEFGLSGAMVARFEPGARPAKQAAQLGASWLVQQLKDGHTLAISWGAALQHLVQEVVAERPYDVEIVQMVGGLSQLTTSPAGHELVRELAIRLGASYRYLHAPAVLDHREAVAALMGEHTIDEVLQAARKADIALVGVGSVGYGSSEVLLEQARLSRTERIEFLARDLAGDVCARFFDRAGEDFLGAANDRVLGLTLEELRKIPTVLGIATGREKTVGLLGALRAGLLDVVCCDVSVARAVLELARKSSKGLAQ